MGPKTLVQLLPYNKPVSYHEGHYHLVRLRDCCADMVARPFGRLSPYNPKP